MNETAKEDEKGSQKTEKSKTKRSKNHYYDLNVVPVIHINKYIDPRSSSFKQIKYVIIKIMQKKKNCSMNENDKRKKTISHNVIPRMRMRMVAGPVYLLWLSWCMAQPTAQLAIIIIIIIVQPHNNRQTI